MSAALAVASPVASPLGSPGPADAFALDPVGALRAAARRARHLAVVTLGQVHDRRRGRPPMRARLNIENFTQLRAAGFPVGTRVRVDYRPGVAEVVRDPQGSIVIAPKRARRRDGTEAVGERLDVRTQKLHAHFRGQARLLVLYLDGRLVVVHPPTVARTAERLRRLGAAARRGALRTASLYAGVGTLDAALHEGLDAAGIRASSALVNDVWDQAVGAYLADNPAASGDTVSFAGGIEELVALGSLARPDLVAMGIPCTGASRLNVGTRDDPERHEAAGHQVLNAVLALQGLGWPPAVLVENVPEWAATASCSMLRRVLHEQGYETAFLGQPRAGDGLPVLDSTAYGTIERRVRIALFAYPRGLSLDGLDVRPTGPSAQTVADVREPEGRVPAGEYAKGTHLFRAERLARGWRPRVVDDGDRETPTLSATCWKQQSESPRFRHPDDPARSRLPLPAEHARLKGHDPRLVNSLPHDSLAHTALGNGTARGPWVAVGRAIGTWLVAQQAAIRAAARALTVGGGDAGRDAGAAAPRGAADGTLDLFAWT